MNIYSPLKTTIYGYEFTLSVTLDDDELATETTVALARILRETGAKVETGTTSGKIRDINGNVVGAFGVKITKK